MVSSHSQAKFTVLLPVQRAISLMGFSVFSGYYQKSTSCVQNLGIDSEIPEAEQLRQEIHSCLIPREILIIGTKELKSSLSNPKT